MYSAAYSVFCQTSEKGIAPPCATVSIALKL